MLRRSSANDDSGASVTVVSVACIYVFNCETTWEALFVQPGCLCEHIGVLTAGEKRLIPLKAVDKGRGNQQGGLEGSEGSRRRRELPLSMSLPGMRHSVCINAPCVFISASRKELLCLGCADVIERGGEMPPKCATNGNGVTFYYFASQDPDTEHARVVYIQHDWITSILYRP